MGEMRAVETSQNPVIKPLNTYMKNTENKTVANDLAYFKVHGNKNRIILSRIDEKNGKELVGTEYVVFTPRFSESFSNLIEAKSRFSVLVSAVLCNGETFLD